MIFSNDALYFARIADHLGHTHEAILFAKAALDAENERATLLRTDLAGILLKLVAA